MLKNRIYLGEIVHKGQAYPGEHQPIVPADLWEQVQARLADNGPPLKRVAGTRHPSLLCGLIIDGLGRRMSPSHANKGSKRYRYYVTHADAVADVANPPWRVAAHDLERIVVARLQAFLADGPAVHAAVARHIVEARRIEAVIADVGNAAALLDDAGARDRAAIVQRYVERVTLDSARVKIVVGFASLINPDDQAIHDGDPVILHAATARVRRGHELRLIVPSAEPRRTVERDERLIELIADAHAARALMLSMPDRSLDQIASAEGRCRTQLSRLIKLSYLGPEIVAMVLEGRQPASLTRRRLMAADLPLAWNEQRTVLGC